MRKMKILALILAAALGAGTLAGCGGSNETIFKIGKESCSLSEAKILLVNYQNQYRDVYGVDLWKAAAEDNEELENYIKDLAISQLAEIYMMAYIGTDQDMELSEAELANVESAAASYYNSLNGTEKDYFGASEKDIAKLYERYAMARKVYTALTKDVNQEVSDDDARVMKVMQIYSDTEAPAKTAYNKLVAGGDFAAVASSYDTSGNINQIIDRESTPDDLEETIFSLSDGEYAPVLKYGEGYYIYYCVSNFEEELTQENKETVLQKRMEDAVHATYDLYTSSTDSKLYTGRWEAIEVNTDEYLTTTDFFDVFEEYCGADYK